MKSFCDKERGLLFETLIAAVQQEAHFECSVMISPQKALTEHIDTRYPVLYGRGISEGTVYREVNKIRNSRLRICRRQLHYNPVIYHSLTAPPLCSAISWSPMIFFIISKAGIPVQ